ncbi:MAG: transposase [Candidatus Coprenecus sp.]
MCKLVMPVLRPGRRNKSINFCGYMKRIITCIRKSWKKTQIVVRSDSHFCSHEFMEWAQKRPQDCLYYRARTLGFINFFFPHLSRPTCAVADHLLSYSYILFPYGVFFIATTKIRKIFLVHPFGQKLFTHSANFYSRTWLLCTRREK